MQCMKYSIFSQDNAYPIKLICESMNFVTQIFVIITYQKLLRPTERCNLLYCFIENYQWVQFQILRECRRLFFRRDAIIPFLLAIMCVSEIVHKKSWMYNTQKTSEIHKIYPSFPDQGKSPSIFEIHVTFYSGFSRNIEALFQSS